jgi:uncharacterized protein
MRFPACLLLALSGVAIAADAAYVAEIDKAFNPYCSLNSNIMCPLVPGENRLDVRIVAGEKYAGGT